MRQLDYLVVGGGIAGLSAAARLARRGATLVCEAEGALGVHASGRSAAFAHFAMDDALVRRLTAASLPHFAEPAARVHPALFVASKSELQELGGLERSYREWAPATHRIPAEEARELVPVLRAHGEHATVAGLLDPQGRKLDADALLQQHRRALKDAGGELVLSSPVAALRREGDRWLVDTPAERLVARVVVNAAGAWADPVARLAGVAPLGLEPRRRTVITFAGPEGTDVSRWPFVKTAGTGLYFEPEGRGRLLASAMDATACEPCDAQPEEEDVALAAWRIEQRTTLQVRRLASRWAGLRTFARDERPVAGFDADAPGFFWLAGQGGFGLQTSPAMALAAEALATRARWPEELRAAGVTVDALSPRRLR